MKYSKGTQIISAFKFGYICSLIENEFESILDREYLGLEVEPLHHNLQTLLLFKDDYEIIFDEEILVFPKYRNELDIEEYLMAFFSFVKGKISEIGKVELELAYYTGATLSLSYENNQNILNVEKYSSIFKLLFAMSDYPKSSEKVDELIIKLVTADFIECMMARNTLFTDITKNYLSEEQASAINYFDRIIVKKY